MQGQNSRIKVIPDIVIERIKTDTERYLNWIKGIDLFVDKNLFLAGPFSSPEYSVWPRYHDNFHYPLGMRKLLSLGFSGIRDRAFKNADKFEGNQREYLLLIHKVYKAITERVREFAYAAKDKKLFKQYAFCLALAENSPNTFLEACQLYWFSALFRIGTSNIGRIDQHLYPYFKRSIKDGSIKEALAAKIIAELLFRYEKRGAGRGDTLQNITLGGRTAAGKSRITKLTYMILKLCLKNKYIEPKLNLRIYKNCPEDLLDLAAEFQYQGTGICTVFNDEAIIQGLRRYGRPAKVAENYCSDGCSEIILDGQGETVFRYIDCIKAIEHVLFNGEENLPEKKSLQYYAKGQDYAAVKAPVEKGLQTGDFLNMRRFDDFYQAYLSQIKYQIDVVLQKPYNSDEYPMRLFTAATMPGVLEKAVEPYSNPASYHTYGLFIGSLGTAVNSIAAIKSLVYEKRLINKKDLLNSLRNNFENHLDIRQFCKDAPKFGNDDDYVDNIAVDIADKFADWVKGYKDRMDRPVLPGLYNHVFHHNAYWVGATPDGRNFGSPIGEHLSPSPGTAYKGPTAIINSVCKINTGRQIFGSTLHLNIPKVSLSGIDKPQNILKRLIQVFSAKNGCVLNTSVLDTQKLIEAQKDPEKYTDLIVRVWGFSYYFTRLSKEMQGHIIERSKKSCGV